MRSNSFILAFTISASAMLMLYSCGKDEPDPRDLLLGQWIELDPQSGRHEPEEFIHEYQKDSVYLIINIETNTVDTLKYFVKGAFLYFGNFDTSSEDIINYSFGFYYVFLENNQKLKLQILDCCVDPINTWLYKRLN
jgi:hypothetical protein